MEVEIRRYDGNGDAIKQLRKVSADILGYPNGSRRIKEQKNNRINGEKHDQEIYDGSTEHQP